MVAATRYKVQTSNVARSLVTMSAIGMQTLIKEAGTRSSYLLVEFCIHIQFLAI